MKGLRCRVAGLLLFQTALTAIPALAQSAYGDAQAIDGDSLVVGGKQVRLFGIDAPEFDQQCQKDGSNWPCGEAAKAQLAELVAGQRVECRSQGVDQHNRILAVCTAGGESLNQAMVEQGWAVAYQEFSDAYVAAQLYAKSNRLGIWGATFIMPSDFRHGKLPPEPRALAQPRSAPKRPAPSWSGGCVIKGNRNRRGQWIYHLPGMPHYDETRAEDIFCTEAEAQAAGYRRAIVRP